MITPTKTGNWSLHTFQFITPAGDPVNNPVDTGEGQNEFTFDASNPGELKMNVKIHSPWIGLAPDDIKEQLVFEIDSIGDSKLVWSSGNEGGKPTFGNQNSEISDMTASLKFVELPKNYDDFGKKKIRLKLAGTVVAEQEFEVFYDGLAKNHRDELNSDYENWFVYYKQNQSYLYPNLGPINGKSYKYGGTGRSKANTTFGRGNLAFIKIGRYGSYLKTSTLAYNEPTSQELSEFNSRDENAIYTVSFLSEEKDMYFKGFIGVLSHEKFHMFSTVNPGSGTDYDSDGLSQQVEQRMGLIHHEKFSAAKDAIIAGNLIALPEKGNPCGNCDDEAIAGGIIEQRGIDLANTENDWANPGTNHKTGKSND